MEIEKIFSEIDTNEKMFSVLMDEEEYALFSEFEERLYYLRADGSSFTGKELEEAAKNNRLRARLRGYDIDRGNSIKDAYVEKQLHSPDMKIKDYENVTREIKKLALKDGQGYGPHNSYFDWNKDTKYARNREAAWEELDLRKEKQLTEPLRKKGVIEFVNGKNTKDGYSLDLNKLKPKSKPTKTKTLGKFGKFLKKFKH